MTLRYRTFPDGSRCVKAGKRIAQIWSRKYPNYVDRDWVFASMFAILVQQRYQRRYGAKIAEKRENGTLYTSA